MDIYFILSSKPHNPHYLKRYHKFILACSEKNVNLSKEIYTEVHHICPKSIFQEFSSLKLHKWNSIILTPRQHFIAHWILWRAYRNQSTAFSFRLMASGFGSKRQRSINYENSLRETKKITSTLNSGMVVAKNKITGRYERLNKSAFNVNRDIYEHKSENFLNVYDLEIHKWVSIDRKNWNKEKQLTVHKFYKWFKNKESNEIIKIGLFDKIPDSDEWEIYKIQNKNKGRFASQETKKKMSDSSRRLKWYNFEGKEYLFEENKQPESWVRGRAKRICYHNPLTKESIKILITETPPEGFFLGSGRIQSDEEKELRRKKSKSKCWITNIETLEEKFVDKKEPLPKGWIFGSFKINKRRDPKTGKLKGI